ncbi:hypothetical protein EGJ48_10110 [Pantoea dispersa]|nr:hypothetical protein EGJ48_10110 [Pantoea dispersa]
MFVFERNNNRKPTLTPALNSIKTFLRDIANISAGKKSHIHRICQVMAAAYQGKLTPIDDEVMRDPWKPSSVLTSCRLTSIWHRERNW